MFCPQGLYFNPLLTGLTNRYPSQLILNGDGTSAVWFYLFCARFNLFTRIFLFGLGLIFAQTQTDRGTRPGKETALFKLEECFPIFSLLIWWTDQQNKIETNWKTNLSLSTVRKWSSNSLRETSLNWPHKINMFLFFFTLSLTSFIIIHPWPLQLHFSSDHYYQHFSFTLNKSVDQLMVVT